MICTSLSDTIGFTCAPLNEDGTVALIDTPFAFGNGEAVPVFVERTGNLVRFFDDGVTLLHLRGRGLKLVDQRNLKPIRTIVESGGVTLSPRGEVEIWSDAATAPLAFAKFMAALLAVSTWEQNQLGVSSDVSLFLDEVVLCLRAWKPQANIAESPEFAGVSGYKYRLDFSVDGEGVLAITPHPNTVSAAAKKLLDIRASNTNVNLKILIIVDDRQDPEMAKREGSILDSVGNVMMMTRLEKNSGFGARN